MLCGTAQIALLDGRAYFLGLLEVPLAHSTVLSVLPGISLSEERTPFPRTWKAASQRQPVPMTGHARL